MHSEQFSGHEGRRARRFDIQLSIHYRASGEIAWREGQTENISYTGVLFRTDELMDVHTPIEMTFTLPPVVSGETGAEVMCRGEIVRTVLHASTDAHPSLAVKILQLHFPRRRKPPEA